MSNWERTASENGCVYAADDNTCIIIGEYEPPLFESDCPYWTVLPRYGSTWRVEVQSLEEAFIWAEGQ